VELTHRFSVPLPIDEAWEQFNDIAAVAECFPGAVVTSADEESFSGTVKVKLGPIALQYNGSGSFVEKDEAARRMVVDAKGKDKRGNGTAGAHVTLTMSEAGSATDIEVVTDLSVTGKPAQFGRGVMQDVSDKLLGQFVSCLEQKHATPAVVEDPAAPEPVAPAEPAAPGEPTPPVEPVPPAPPPPRRDDSIDLGTTVLPVLARTYGPWLVGAVVLLLLVRWLRRR
jgi:uncharacterized protein